jgi:predicted alpha/beta hydrolase family esterase
MAEITNRAVIAHRWMGRAGELWHPYVIDELAGLHIAASVPQLPSPDQPNIRRWVAALSEDIGEPDERTFLIGHSLGCRAILEYVALLPGVQKVGGIVLVAGNLTRVGFPQIANFFEQPVDYAAVREHVAGGVELIYSVDDPWVPIAHGEELRDQLNGDLTLVEGAKHFSYAYGDTPDCTALPEAIAAMKRLAAAPHPL